MGPVISKAAKERIENYITQAEEMGATIVVDGRNCTVAGKEEGYYVGPTIIDGAAPHFAAACEEAGL